MQGAAIFCSLPDWFFTIIAYYFIKKA
jgi:hypothetical protein